MTSKTNIKKTKNQKTPKVGNTDPLSGVVAVNKKRAEIISDYIKKSKIKSTKRGYVIINGKEVEQEAHTIPRKFLRLNPFNHRFTTMVNILKSTRIQNGKSPEFDLTDKSDIAEIRNMLRGIEPSNVERKNKYDSLLIEVENHSIKHGNNGLTDVCIVTADGTYINGNRRDTVLEDLTQVEVNKKRAGVPQKYDSVDVIVCPSTITYSDIRLMEMKEQVSLSQRDEYDYMNTALLIKEEYDNQLLMRGIDKEKEVIKILANVSSGRTDKFIIEHLEFLKFIDLVLEQLHLDGEYHKINRKTDDEKDSTPVTTICREHQKKWTEASDADKPARVMLCAAYCQGVFGNSKTNESDYQFTSRNHRNLTSSLKTKKSKDLIDNYDWFSHDFTSDKGIKQFGNTLQLAEEYAKNEKWMESPVKVLRAIESSFQTIDDALSSSESKKIKTKLEEVKVDRSLKSFVKYIASIELKLKNIK